MGIFDYFKRPDIDQGIADYRQSPGAILLDVRTPLEYREGHIPESKNIPLQTIDNVGAVVENKDVTLFVYCQSGVRSQQAVNMLRHMGYTRVNNIGGIAAYSGKVVR